VHSEPAPKEVAKKNVTVPAKPALQKKPIVEEPAPVPVKEEEPVEYDPYLKKPTE